MKRPKTLHLINRCRRWLDYVAIVLIAIAFSSPALPVVADEETRDTELSKHHKPAVLSASDTNTVIQIPVAQDTYVTSNRPNTNWGSAPNLYLGYDLSQNDDGAERILLQFDLTGQVPAHAVINQAYIELYEHEATPSGDSPMGNIVRHLNSQWNADEVTWNNHEPNWGGISDRGEIDSNAGWHQFDITALVTEWVDGATPNYGVIIIGDERVQERQRVFYSLNANNDLYPRLVIDYTISTDTTPPTVTVDPLPAFVATNFYVTWSGTDNPGGSGIAYYDVQYMIPGHGWQNWQMHTTNTSAEFTGGQNGVTYEFRARGVDNAGNVEPFSASAQAQTIVDTVAPTASVNPLPVHTFYPAFNVTWSGSDNAGGSGIAYYNVQYQINDGSWQDWLVHTTATSAQYTGGQNTVTYGFRVQAVDNVGNVQPYSSDAQASTTIETAPPTSHILPFPAPLLHTDSFQVSWTGQAAPGKQILYYDVRYRIDSGAWTLWQQQAVDTSAEFTATAGDGLYEFEVRASDNYGALEAFSTQSAATVIVDTQPPFVVPRMYIPLVRR